MAIYFFKSFFKCFTFALCWRFPREFNSTPVVVTGKLPQYSNKPYKWYQEVPQDINNFGIKVVGQAL